MASPISENTSYDSISTQFAGVYTLRSTNKKVKYSPREPRNMRIMICSFEFCLSTIGTGT